MNNERKLEFGKLLGFQSIPSEIKGSVDFRDATVSARLGAKVGELDGGTPEVKIAFERLLGFGAVSEQLANGADFHDPTVSAKLGAKVGELDK